MHYDVVSIVADTNLQKIKQRYNSSRSMHSKINISQLQEEIRLRPPHMITPEELRPGGGATAADSADTQAHFTLGIDFFKSYILYNTVLRIVCCPMFIFFLPFHTCKPFCP